MQFMSSTSVNCIEEMRLLMPMLLLPLLLLLLLLAKKFLAISNSNVEKRAVAADRVDGENTLLDSLANCVPRPPSGPQQHSGQCSSWSTGRGGWQGSDATGMPGCRTRDTFGLAQQTLHTFQRTRKCTEICSRLAKQERGRAGRGIAMTLTTT